MDRLHFTHFFGNMKLLYIIIHTIKIFIAIEDRKTPVDSIDFFFFVIFMYDYIAYFPGNIVSNHIVKFAKY